MVSSQRKPTAHSSSQTYLCQEGVSNTNSNSDLTLGDLPTGIPATRSLTCKVVQSDNTIDGGNIISGTYVHSLLIPHIACWISVDFALKVSEVINGYIVYEYMRKAEDLEVQLEITTNATSIQIYPEILFLVTTSVLFLVTASVLFLEF